MVEQMTHTLPRISARRELQRRTFLATSCAVICNSLILSTAVGATSKSVAEQPAGMLVLLGTQGGPNFTPERGETASALLVGESLFLIDCGYGALAALYRAQLDLQTLNAICLTHLHDDHTADLISILTHLATRGRTRDLVVYGPKGTNALISAALAVMTPNAEIRQADEHRPVSFLSFIRSVEMEPGQTHPVDPAVRISCAENTHYPAVIEGLETQGSLSYRFDWGKSVVFSGDTTYSENLVALATGADVFVCEVLEPVAMRTAFERMVAGGAFAGVDVAVWRHMLDTHASPEQVGMMAAAAGVNRVVLNHLAPGTLLELPEAVFMRAVGELFHGPITVGHDGMTIAI